MVIELEKVRELCKILINTMDILGLQQVQSETDYYWVITSNHREDFSTPTPEICVGSLHDDWQELTKILTGEHPPTLVDFDRLATVFITIGESISKSEQAFYQPKARLINPTPTHTTDTPPSPAPPEP